MAITIKIDIMSEKNKPRNIFKEKLNAIKEKEVAPVVSLDVGDFVPPPIHRTYIDPSGETGDREYISNIATAAMQGLLGDVMVYARMMNDISMKDENKRKAAIEGLVKESFDIAEAMLAEKKRRFNHG